MDVQQQLLCTAAPSLRDQHHSRQISHNIHCPAELQAMPATATRARNQQIYTTLEH